MAILSCFKGKAADYAQLLMDQYTTKKVILYKTKLGG